jgi:hypothetical protein
MTQTAATNDGNAQQSGSKTLVGLIDQLKEAAEGEEISIGEIAKALDRRGIGSLFVITSLLAILPTGAIPGMSVLTGIIMLVLSAQLLVAKRDLWLPRFVTRRTIPAETFCDSLDRARKPAERIGRLLKPRMEAVLEPPFLQMLAGFGIIISLSMFPLAVVPFGAFPAGIAFLVIGTGLAVRDGLVVAVGIGCGFAGLVAAWYLWPY